MHFIYIYILYIHIYIYIYIYIMYVTRSRGTMCLARTWRYLRKIFSNVYIRAAQLIVKNCACGLDSNTHAILFLNDNDSARHTSRVSVEREKHVLLLPMLMNQRVGHHHASDVNAVIHWYGRRQNVRFSSSTDTRDVKTCDKDIQICIHAAAGPERATQTVYSTTHDYFCVTDI